MLFVLPNGLTGVILCLIGVLLHQNVMNKRSDTDNNRKDGFMGKVVFQAYKFASNEYRFFPARFQLNFCDALKKNLFGFNSFFQCGNFTGCPMKKEVEVFICKWSPNQFRFPPFIPNGKYMMEVQGLFRNTEVCIFRGYGNVFRPFGEK